MTKYMYSFFYRSQFDESEYETYTHKTHCIFKIKQGNNICANTCVYIELYINCTFFIS